MEHDGQRRAETKWEEAVEAILDYWEEEYEEGRDHTVEELCSRWPKEWLDIVNERVAACRAALEGISEMMDENDEVETTNDVFEAGKKVPGTDYTFEKKLGEGGYGQAWLVRNPHMAQPCVFKFCSPQNVDALKNEAELLKHIQKECADAPERFAGFVKILGTHVRTGPHYYVEYEYVPEGNLRQYMEKLGRPFSPFEAAEIILQLANIMAVAHTLSRPIIHRDLKPENILLSRSAPFPPELKISDFGIGGVALAASAAASEYMKDYGKNLNVVSRDYASLEQLHDASRREANDDVYALGVIFYELLANATDEFRVPDNSRKVKNGLRRGLTAAQIAFLQSKRGVTDDQIEFLKRCFAHEGERPANAKEMADKIRDPKVFPPLRQLLQHDIEQIAERRKKGENCRTYITQAFSEKIAIWNEAARQDLPEAQWLCGMCWEMELGTAPKLNQYEQAVYWFRKAAAQRNAEAQYCLACYQRFGLGGVANREVGWNYDGVSPVLSTPVSELNLSVRARKCMIRLGISTLGELICHTADDLLECKNFGVTTLNEVREALASKGIRLSQTDWLEKAAAGGQIDALYELGSHWWQTAEERKRLTPDDEEAGQKLTAKLGKEIACLCGAAHQGHVEAQISYSLHVLFDRELFDAIFDDNFALDMLTMPGGLGQCKKISEQDCLTWLKAAAKREHVEANFLLGKYYEEGIKELPEPNKDEAIKHYRVAAEAGHLEAQFRLWECLRKMVCDTMIAEEGEPEDLVKRCPRFLVQCNEAIRWCMTAANREHAGAQFRLGNALWSGWEGDDTFPLLGEEKQNAVRWICKAALQGHQEAMGFLTGVNDRLIDDHVDTFFWDYPVAWEALHDLAKCNATGAFYLATIYSLADVGKQRDYEKAGKWLHNAAELGHPRAIEMVLEGLQQVPKDESTPEFSAYDELDWQDYEEFDASVETRDEELEMHRKYGGMDSLGSFVLEYQRMAELGHEEAAKRLAEMGDASTKAIMHMLRPVDQRPPSPKTP